MSPILDTWGAVASAAIVLGPATCKDTPEHPSDCAEAVAAVPIALVTGVLFTWAAIHGYRATHECRCAHAAWAAFHSSSPPLATPAGTIPPPISPCDQLRAELRAATDARKRFELAKQIRASCRERPSAPPPDPR